MALILQRNIILALLIVVAAAAWTVLVWQWLGMDTDMRMYSPTMGMKAPLFLVVWMIMMIAMMFPTAAPMVLTFHRVQAGKRGRGETFVSTWFFVAAYMLLWGAMGALAFAGAAGGELIAAHAGRGTHGPGAWAFLPRLLLAFVRRSFSSRDHEHRRDGCGHLADLCRKDPAVRGEDRKAVGCRSAPLWRSSVGLSAGAANLPAHGSHDHGLTDGGSGAADLPPRGGDDRQARRGRIA